LEEVKKGNSRTSTHPASTRTSYRKVKERKSWKKKKKKEEIILFRRKEKEFAISWSLLEITLNPFLLGFGFS